MVSITDPSVIASIAGTGAAIFMIGLGLFIEKTKKKLKVRILRIISAR